MFKVHFLSLTLILFLSAQAQMTILSEDFESGIPATWAIAYGADAPKDFELSKYDTAWIALAENDTSTTNMVAASSSYFTTPNTASNFLITPQVTLDVTVNHISLRARSRDGSYPDRFVVYAGKDSIVDSLTNIIYTSPFIPNTWFDIEINLEDAGLSDTALYFAFELMTDDGFELYLDDIEIYSDAPLSTNNLSTTSFSIYPNPCSEFIAITTDANITAWQIYSIEGKVILSGEGTHISLGKIENGTYILKAITEKNELITERFVKKS